jgi:hypothetical protein
LKGGKRNAASGVMQVLRVNTRILNEDADQLSHGSLGGQADDENGAARVVCDSSEVLQCREISETCLLTWG